jgi:chemotaxis protein CheC
MVEINLNAQQEDVLREIGNIGAGTAATAMGQLLNKTVLINVPKVSLLSMDQLTPADFSINTQEISIIVASKILGALRGGMFVLFSHKSALTLIDILLERKMGSTELFNLSDASALTESSHILCGSYLNAVGEFLNLHHLIPAIPQTIVDRVNKMDQVLLKRFVSQDVSYILPIENRMIIADIELNISVNFLLEYESVNKIIKIVGL